MRHHCIIPNRDIPSLAAARMRTRPRASPSRVGRTNRPSIGWTGAPVPVRAADSVACGPATSLRCGAATRPQSQKRAADTSAAQVLGGTRRGAKPALGPVTHWTWQEIVSGSLRSTRKMAAGPFLRNRAKKSVHGFESRRLSRDSHRHFIPAYRRRGCKQVQSPPIYLAWWSWSESWGNFQLGFGANNGWSYSICPKVWTRASPSDSGGPRDLRWNIPTRFCEWAARRHQTIDCLRKGRLVRFGVSTNLSRNP